jgi:hypothetical protein
VAINTFQKKNAYFPALSTLQLLTYSLRTYSMEQSPSSEANRLSASQQIPRILWNPKVQYRIRKCTPPVPILCTLQLLLHLNSLRVPHNRPPSDVNFLMNGIYTSCCILQLNYTKKTQICGIGI